MSNAATQSAAPVITKYRPAASSAMERACPPIVCGCCGREDLKTTVKMVDAAGAVVWMGTGCAARAMGVGVKEYKAEAKRVEDEAERTARVAFDAHFARVSAWLTSKVGPGSRFEQLQRIGGSAVAWPLYQAETGESAYA